MTRFQTKRTSRRTRRLRIVKGAPSLGTTSLAVARGRAVLPLKVRAMKVSGCYRARRKRSAGEPLNLSYAFFSFDPFRLIFTHPQILIDETQTETVSDDRLELVFDVYDFLRLCKSRPDRLIEEGSRRVVLPLHRLRDYLAQMVNTRRASLKQTLVTSAEVGTPFRRSRPRTQPQSFYTLPG